MCLMLEAGANHHHHNLPTSDEVALIIVDEYGEPCSCDIILTYHDSTSLFRIDPNHAAYMLLHYVLFFLHGEAGWHWGLELLNTNRARMRTCMTQRAFYQYCLYTYEHSFNMLFRGGRLFQQYIVDA